MSRHIACPVLKEHKESNKNKLYCTLGVYEIGKTQDKGKVRKEQVIVIMSSGDECLGEPAGALGEPGR